MVLKESKNNSRGKRKQKLIVTAAEVNAICPVLITTPGQYLDFEWLSTEDRSNWTWKTIILPLISDRPFSALPYGPTYPVT